MRSAPEGQGQVHRQSIYAHVNGDGARDGGGTFRCVTKLGNFDEQNSFGRGTHYNANTVGPRREL